MQGAHHSPICAKRTPGWLTFHGLALLFIALCILLFFVGLLAPEITGG